LGQKWKDHIYAKDTHCILDLIRLLFYGVRGWLLKSSGIVLLEHDIDEAIKEFGTANKKIITHIENIIAQKALISSKGIKVRLPIK
jgi:hypothetical protein